MFNSILKNHKLVWIFLLFLWVSLFPYKIQEKYHFFTNTYLFSIFVIFLTNKPSQIFKKENLLLLVFLLALGFSLFSAQQRALAFKNFFNLAVPIAALYFILPAFFSSKRDLSLFVRLINITNILICLLAIFECIFRFNPLYTGLVINPYYERYITGFARPMSTQYNPTALGAFLVGTLPFSLTSYRQEGGFFRLLAASALILNIVTVLLTFSRGAFLGLVVIFAIYFLIEKRYVSVIALLTLFLFIIISFSYLPYPLSKLGITGIIADKAPVDKEARQEQLYPATEIIEDKPGVERERAGRFGSDWIYADALLSSYRVKRMKIALEMLKSSPLTGLGLGHYKERFYEFYHDRKDIPYEIRIADNMYLTLLAETGIIGFLSFFIFAFYLLKKTCHRIKGLDSQSYERYFLSAALLAFSGLLVNMAGFEFFYWPNQYILFCMIIGCLGVSIENKLRV